MWNLLRRDYIVLKSRVSRELRNHLFFFFFLMHNEVHSKMHFLFVLYFIPHNSLLKALSKF